jgi:leucyl aminopeptidase (aminopeptidase T)
MSQWNNYTMIDKSETPQWVRNVVHTCTGFQCGSSAARITIALGTDLRLSLTDRESKTDSGILRGRGVLGNLPSGEMYIAPIEDSAEGVLVVESPCPDCCFPNQCGWCLKVVAC